MIWPACLQWRSAAKAVAWTLFALTIGATIHLGWHYVVDDLAGMVIGVLARLIKPGKQRLSMVATLVLGVVFCIVGTTLDCTWALLAGSAGSWVAAAWAGNRSAKVAPEAGAAGGGGAGAVRAASCSVTMFDVSGAIWSAI